MTDVLTFPTKHEHFYQNVEGFFWFEEAYRRLLMALPTDQPSRWVEIGSYQGKSASWLGVEILNSGKPVHLYCVDSFVGWDGELQGLELLTRFQENTKPIRDALGDRFTVWPLPSLEAAECFEDNSCDVVFVDGDHEYNAVLADISAWWPKLKVGGFMAGDDFNMYPVMRAVVEHFAPSGYILVHGWNDHPTQAGPWPTWIARKV